MPEPMTLEEAVQLCDDKDSRASAEQWLNATDVLVAHARATLAQRREGVTAAMVEAACVAMFQWWTLSTTTHADRELARIDMHDALTAALGARDGGAD